MYKINILDSSIYNRIAAGEVVENPRSIVKELVENSIDAGADKISVEITGGGVEFLRVVDNGCGISEADMPRAFIAHATSKISSIKDLDAIASLGFRGEALASIASVANVTMTSRVEGAEMGNKLIVSHGVEPQMHAVGCPYGTSVTVEKLFENVPARAKFLRKNSAEEADVAELISKLILSNPKISISLTINGELKYQSYGKGVEDALSSVYGASVLDSVKLVQYQAQDISLFGYVGVPSFTKHNRNYQTLIVNGRYVVNNELSYVVQQCYSQFLMKRQFPFYVIYLDLPLDMVDVNVHPNKMDVRFANQKYVRGIIYSQIKQVVEENAYIPPDVNVAVVPSVVGAFNEEIVSCGKYATINDNSRKDNSRQKIDIANDIKSETSVYNKNFAMFNDKSNVLREPTLFETWLIEKDYEQNKGDVAHASKTFLPEEEITIVGKLFNTYIIVQSGEVVYFIDQHAAHEKLLYDKMVAKVESKTLVTQSLIVPYEFDLQPSDAQILSENLGELENCGFVIKRLKENTFSLLELPLDVVDINVKQFIDSIMSHITYENKVKTIDFIRETVMQNACKAAVKGEDDLSKFEISSLIEMMKGSNSKLFCPHGRPTVLSIKRSEFEKWFKRRV